MLSSMSVTNKRSFRPKLPTKWINRLSRVNTDLITYCIFPFLDDLTGLRGACKAWKTRSDAYLTSAIQMELKNPDLGLKDALWYYGILARSESKIRISTASKEYRLSPRQIHSLKHRRNLVYTRVKMADIKDVLQLALERHKSAENLLQYKNKLTERLKARNDIILQAKAKLERYLKPLGLSVRQYDPFIALWLRGKIDVDAKRLAEYQARRLYLSSYFDEEILDRLTTEYPCLHSEETEGELESILLLERLDIDYPKVWPWLEHKRRTN